MSLCCFEDTVLEKSIILHPGSNTFHFLFDIDVSGKLCLAADSGLQGPSAHNFHIKNIDKDAEHDFV